MATIVRHQAVGCAVQLLAMTVLALAKGDYASEEVQDGGAEALAATEAGVCQAAHCGYGFGSTSTGAVNGISIRYPGGAWHSAQQTVRTSSAHWLRTLANRSAATLICSRPGSEN